VVAGGSAFTATTAANLEIAGWLRKHGTRAEALVSICAGAFTLGEAGLLDGRRATTHWMALERLQACFPKAHVVDEGIHVKDGPIWTSAGAAGQFPTCCSQWVQHQS